MDVEMKHTCKNCANICVPFHGPFKCSIFNLTISEKALMLETPCKEWRARGVVKQEERKWVKCTNCFTKFDVGGGSERVLCDICKKCEKKNKVRFKNRHLKAIKKLIRRKLKGGKLMQA